MKKTLLTVGFSDMKKFLFCALALLITMTACNIIDPVKTEESNAKTITVKAGQAGTKTAITEQDGQFSVNWKKGDKIVVIEGLPEVAAYNESHYPDEYIGEPTEHYASDPLSQDMENAVFSLDLEPRDNIFGEIQYVAVYPTDQVIEVSGGDWDNEKKRMIVTIDFPRLQYPSADSFDPNADVLVSKVVTCATRPDQLSFQFARVGTIVKLVLTGLPEGAHITNGNIELGIEAGYWMEYDPVEQRIMATDGTDGISFEFGSNPLVVGPDRSATIWLRCMSGISDFITLYLYGYNDGESLDWYRTINLRALGRRLEFKDGGLTTFSLRMGKPDVDNPNPDEIDYSNNETLDGVTVTWPHSTNPNLDGYECFLLDDNNVRHDFDSVGPIQGGLYAATVNSGLAPGVYTFYVRAVAVDGKESQHDFAEVYDLHIGIPLEIHISYPSSHNSGSSDNVDLAFSGYSGDDEDLYRDIVYGFRSLSWINGSPNHFIGRNYSKPWAFWNKTPVNGWYRITVKSYNNASAARYNVYASDTVFDGGLPSGTDSPLIGTHTNSGHVYQLSNHLYFLIEGLASTESCEMEEIILEYYK